MRSRLNNYNNESKFKKIGSFLFYSACIVILTSVFLGLFISLNSNHEKIVALQNKVNLLENTLSSTDSKTCKIKDSMQRISKSVVRIIGGEAEGSGFAIDKNTIITNFHVIAFEASPKVVLPNDTFQSAQIIMADKDADLAFLKINADIPILPLGDSNSLSQTDQLYSMGFPFGGNLQGELTVAQGILAGTRHFKDSNIDFLQTDALLNPGVSGGPMTNSCGQVVGINTLGGSGMGFAISSASILTKWQEMKTSGNDPLKDITVLNIQPNIDPKNTVEAYYDYIKLRRLDKAFELLGDYKKNFTFDNWKKGYASNLDTTVLNITSDDTNTSKINIKLSTKDLVNGEIIYKYFEGYWLVQKVKNNFLLQKAQIKEIINPDYNWFPQ